VEDIEMNSRLDYSNNLENLKRLWLFSSYILDNNLEESFISYLLEITEGDEVLGDLTSTAKLLIEEYQIDVDVYLKQMIPII
jgi:predicted nucleotidyltransferase